MRLNPRRSVVDFTRIAGLCVVGVLLVCGCHLIVVCGFEMLKELIEGVERDDTISTNP